MAVEIEAIDRRDAKRFALVTYAVAGERRSGAIALTGDQGVGDKVALRYDPENPNRHWRSGSDPPGADTWTFGPFGVVGILLLMAYRRRASDLRRGRGISGSRRSPGMT